jgi:uncharacterized repeat protein (TIGR01451 family)
MGQLAADSIYKNTTAGEYSVTGATASFKNDNMGGEDFRAPWRTALNYLWNGNPTTSWDPVNHVTFTASNTYEFDAAIKEANFLSDPVANGSGITCQSYGSSPVTYDGIASLQGYMLDGTAGGFGSNWHVPYIMAGSTAAVVASQNFDEMGEFFRELAVDWDQVGGTDNYLGSMPHYFHGYFRWLGLTILTGNMINPKNWNPIPNMRVFKSLDKTYSFPGDTVTFWLNYRNYGSVTASNVVITDTLPAAFSFASATCPGAVTCSHSGQIVTFNIGTVPGLQNQNYNATEGGVTLVVNVMSNAAEGRYCNFADIACSNGTGGTSSPFPNSISTIMCRTCVDIVAAALTITKTASEATANVGDTITYTLDFCNSAKAGWINGGRSGVNFSFGLNSSPSASSNVLDFYLRGNHEAAEPMIDWANYRLSYFLNSTYSGTNWTSSYYNVEGFNSTPIQTESFVACSPTACSDGTGSWNQRLMVQFGTFGSSTAEPTHMLFWKAGTAAAIHFGTELYAFFGEAAITAGWANQDWTDDWSQQQPWAVVGQSDPLFPISPDWTKGDGTSTVVTKINKDACETSPYQITNILIEEWDGYTWRRVFGNGPMPGREVDNVHVIDSLPTYINFGGVISAPAGSTLTQAGKSFDWSVGNMQINQCGEIKYWARVLDPGCPGAGGTVETNIAYVKADKEAPVSDSAAVIINCPGGTRTFTPTVTRTITSTITMTSTQTSTPTSTMTFTPTVTQTNTQTVTRTMTPSVTYTNTSTLSPTSTPTASPSQTITQTSTQILLSATITQTITVTGTPTLTLTSTQTATQSSTQTGTPSVTWTSTQTPASTATNTQTDSPTSTVTSTDTQTATTTSTMTITPTPTISPVYSLTDTVTATPTGTPSATMTSTRTSTGTPSITYTSTQTTTPTPSNTFTGTQTVTGTSTASPTPSATRTSTGTKTITPTMTGTFTRTASPTITPSATVTLTPAPSPVNMQITLNASGDNPKPGSKITYDITIRNPENRDATNINIWDTLPDGCMITDVISPSPYTYQVNGGVISWDLTGLDLGPATGLDQITVEYTVEITDLNAARNPSDGLIHNTASVNYNDPAYPAPGTKHPPLKSDLSLYPTGNPVVFPNPFNPKTAKGGTLKFANMVPGSVIQIFTISGEAVAAISAQSPNVEWNGKNSGGSSMAAGIYFFVITNKTTNSTLKGKLFVVNN